MKDKKILIASWTYYPAWSYGGIARVMYELSKSLVHDEYQVDAITTDVLDNTTRYDKKRETSEGIEIYFFRNMSNWIANRLKTPLPFGLGRWLSAHIQEYDIVHIGDFRNLFNYQIYRYCRRFHIPYILSPFGTVPYTRDAKGIFKPSTIISGHGIFSWERSM